MIAARQIAFGRGAAKWINPYITDGLIAMWDGEWNAGGGLYRPAKCEVCNVRLCSRTLTADEIAHNYEIDKARFGL